MWAALRSLSVVLLMSTLAGCRGKADTPTSRGAPQLSDSAYAAMQQRGAMPAAMGVDQYTSAHRFDDAPDGGRIELQREVDDSAGVAQIRLHLRHIAQEFARGNFEIPGFVHDRAAVPGTQIMREKHDAIQYEFRELPRGGEVRISSADPDAIQAIHTFLAFQRSEHRAPGHIMH